MPRGRAARPGRRGADGTRTPAQRGLPSARPQPRSARAKREAGADLVQLYTGLIYRGPALVAEAARALRG